MTTATPIRHGVDDRCYRHGCRRSECRNSYRLTRKKAELRRLRGIPGAVPGTRVAAHLEQLLASGWTRRSIAKATGVSDRTIRYILAGQDEVQLRTASALLALGPIAEPARIDATGTRRRIQALAALGWPIIRTAEMAGCSHRLAFDILNGSLATIERPLASSYAAVYRAYSSRPGPSKFTSNRAVGNGWHGPLAWDDIDDPNCQPDIDQPAADDVAAKRDNQRNEEIRHLAAYGIPHAEIAARVGLSRARDVTDRLNKWAKEAAA